MASLIYLKRVIWPNSGGKCCYCGKKLKFRDATIDHFIPQVKGGETDAINCVIACDWCNGKKANRVFETIELASEFLKGLQHGR